MKGIFSLLLSIWVLSAAIPVYASTDSSIPFYVNGNKLHTATGVKIIDKHVYAPIQVMEDYLGVQIEWIRSENKIIVWKQDKSAVLFVSEKNATINGKGTMLPATPLILNETAMIPLRAVAEFLGIKLIWDAPTQSVHVYTPGQKGSIRSIKQEAAAVPLVLANEGLSGVNIGQLDKLAAVEWIENSGDQITIRADKKLSPAIFYLSGPDRIVIDLPYSAFSATLNGTVSSQSGEIAADHPLIENIRYAQFSTAPSTVRVVVDLKGAASYRLVEGLPNEVNILLIQSTYNVVIDPGHGAEDPGTTGFSGKYEKHFTLSLSSKIVSLLEKEAAVQPILTRANDTYPSLDERVSMANQVNADLFISIHGNSYKNSSIRGTETYYSKNDSKKLADIIHKHVVEASEFPDRQVRKLDYRVIRDNSMPSVLVEFGYLSNMEEEKMLLQEDVQWRLAEAVVAAVKEYLGIFGEEKNR